jgi:hypothetical protein
MKSVHERRAVVHSRASTTIIRPTLQVLSMSCAPQRVQRVPPNQGSMHELTYQKRRLADFHTELADLYPEARPQKKRATGNNWTTEELDPLHTASYVSTIIGEPYEASCQICAGSSVPTFRTISNGLRAELQQFLSTLPRIVLELTEENLEMHETALSCTGTPIDQINRTKRVLGHYICNLRRLVNKTSPQYLHHTLIQLEDENPRNTQNCGACSHCSDIGCMISRCTATTVSFATTPCPYDPLHDPFLPCCPPIGNTASISS